MPKIVAEFDDSALMKTFGEAGLGAFAAPDVISDDVERCFNVRQIGIVDGVTETFTAISPQRRLRHTRCSRPALKKRLTEIQKMTTTIKTLTASVIALGLFGAAQANQIPAFEYTAPQQSISAESQNQLIQNYGLAAVAPGKSSVAQRYLVKRQISRANHVDYTLSTPVFFN